MTARVVLVLLLIASACSSPPRPATAATPSPTAPQAGTVPPNRAPPPATAPATCGGPPLRVAFYAVGQGLAALITLPDDRHILVDTGESPTRPGCGKPCKLWHQHLMAGLAHDLGDAPIDLLWITHPHGLESAQTSLKLALRASDLLSDHDKKLLHDTLETLAGIEQRSWTVHAKGRALDTPSKQRRGR